MKLYRRGAIFLWVVCIGLCLTGCGAPATFTLSGRVLMENDVPVEGVCISFSGGLANASTDAAGNWIRENVSGAVTITPSRSGWSFDPPTRTVDQGANNVDFIATPLSPTYTISGRVLTEEGVPLEGVSLSFSGGLANVSSDAAGNWIKENLTGTITVTPSRPGWSFDPDNRAVDQANHNVYFTAHQLKVKAVSAGYEFSLALMDDGSVWAWGDNSYNQLGLSTSVAYNKNLPVKVEGLPGGITAISAGRVHALARAGDGTVWAWGYNYYGQLGDGTNTTTYQPVQVSGLTNVTAISANSYQSLALKADGTVWSWGYNNDGQLGTGNTTNRNTPGQVPGLTGISAICAGGTHSVAIKNDGSLYTWGENSSGQLGRGNNTASYSPVHITITGEVAKKAAAGWAHTLVWCDGYDVYAAGRNAEGQLGLNDYTGRDSFTKLTKTFSFVAAGSYHSLGGNMFNILTWGDNDQGQLGLGDTINRNLPVQVNGVSNPDSGACGVQHSLVLLGGDVWAWGINDEGQLGTGDTLSSLTPVKVKFPY